MWGRPWGPKYRFLFTPTFLVVRRGSLERLVGHLGSVLGRLGGILCLTSCQIMAKHRHAIFDVISHDFRLKLPPNTDPKMWKIIKLYWKKSTFEL